MGLIIAFAACTAKHHEAASGAAVSEAIGSQAPLRACELRTFDAGGVTVTLTSNVDATLGAVRLSDADPEARAQLLDAIRERFGAVKIDPRVQTRPNKWGLNVMLDACGRPPDLSPSASP
jgi:hypothetical protein